MREHLQLIASNRPENGAYKVKGNAVDFRF